MTYNSANKIEPKFKVGDWIVSGKSIAQISDIQGQYYIGIDIYGNDLTLRSDKIRLWTLQDTKEGDVLANGHHILILKESIYDWSPDGTPYYVKAYCGIKPNGNFYIGKDNWCFCGTFHPATKEQRDSLFSKMKQKDYEWNDENKKLSKKQQLKITPKFCVGQVITDDNGTWYKITNIKCSDDWQYEVYDVCEDTAHLELCSIIDEKFRENRFVGEIKKMMGD